MHTVKNPGEGFAYIFAKKGVREWEELMLLDKIFMGSLFWVLLTSFLKICLGGPLIYPIPPYPLTPPRCASMHQTHLFKVFDHGRGQVDVVVVLVEDQGIQVRVEVKLGRVPGGNRILNRKREVQY